MNPFNYTSELLTATLGDAIVAADTWQKSSKSIRVESGAKLRFHVDYVPNATEEAADTVELNVQLLYLPQAADTEDVSGGSGTFDWKAYTIEVARSSPPTGVSEVQPALKRWTIDSAQADPGSSITPNPLRSFSFEVTLPAKRVALEFFETGHGLNTRVGNVKAWCIHGII